MRLVSTTRLPAGRRRNRGSILSRGKKFRYFPQRPDRLLGPPKLLLTGYRKPFRRRLNGRGVKLTTYFQPVPRLRMTGSIISAFTARIEQHT